MNDIAVPNSTKQQSPHLTATSPEGVVRAMFEAARVGDVVAFDRCWTDDAVWHNMPIKPVHTRTEIVSKWMPLLKKPGSFRVEYLNVVASGSIVMTERLDYIEIRGLKVVAPVAGVFEIRDGKIAANREYWDLVSGTVDMVRRTIFGP